MNNDLETLKYEVEIKAKKNMALYRERNKLNYRIRDARMENEKLIEDLEILEKVIENKRLELLNMSGKESFIYSTLKDNE